jgi:hypothetical protein
VRGLRHGESRQVFTGASGTGSTACGGAGESELSSDSNPDPSTTRKLPPRSHGVAACSAGFNSPERRFSFKR